MSTFDLYPSSSLSFQILVTKFYQSGQLFQKSRLQRPINLFFLPLHLFRYTKIASPSKNHPPLPSLLFHGRIPIKRKQLDAATERKGGDESELNETDVERGGKKNCLNKLAPPPLISWPTTRQLTCSVSSGRGLRRSHRWTRKKERKKWEQKGEGEGKGKKKRKKGGKRAINELINATLEHSSRSLFHLFVRISRPRKILQPRTGFEFPALLSQHFSLKAGGYFRFDPISV